ncbi:hypothetical protein EJ08DRAFT_71044 [Tothia fuscella]|uniref:Uncharacterized protein n=1 Tax=Tothia fuscella TaxID=1048955 RepID=A0A9P4NEW5_9PEZI|nr:hypothetical protein EJ08DRAFT_71044 [Tothia fuscella]
MVYVLISRTWKLNTGTNVHEKKLRKKRVDKPWTERLEVDMKDQKRLKEKKREDRIRSRPKPPGHDICSTWWKDSNEQGKYKKASSQSACGFLWTTRPKSVAGDLVMSYFLERRCSSEVLEGFRVQLPEHWPGAFVLHGVFPAHDNQPGRGRKCVEYYADILLRGHRSIPRL